ncbi:MAG: hypothetical protein V2A79_09815 [Planctomycetota bacterium]
MEIGAHVVILTTEGRQQRGEPPLDIRTDPDLAAALRKAHDSMEEGTAVVKTLTIDELEAIKEYLLSTPIDSRSDGK